MVIVFKGFRHRNTEDTELKEPFFVKLKSWWFCHPDFPSSGLLITLTANSTH